ncbi:hypothetical protein [Acinetobacter sp. MD2(2019)]|uniref:hypothetical protein n=1 Tax=Acinetobacter sp. MD2(2019) TaxID=2605273 RepID=UPI002D1EC8D5|nr:hypothetical protein [Acinetobacter sp. MD2(2019)]MEB3753653.1 hypothetical protein [Acinetobacter sp. MD2(2019)]
MAFDSIWQQQLTLVCYGNEFLSNKLSIADWKQHTIFNQHLLQFKDLLSQHLLAQHFEIWLEHLKQQGVTRLSLHSSSLLNEEKNPNPNVELLPFAHFIVSHGPKENTAWILGKELPVWYTADNDYIAPLNQQNPLRDEVLWRFELPAKLTKKIKADLQQPDWEQIEAYLHTEILHSPYAVTQNSSLYKDYIGNCVEEAHETTIPQALLPTQYHAQLANDLLFQLTQLQNTLKQQKQTQAAEDGTTQSPEQQRELLHFSEKVDELFAKLIVKIANHYQTAQRKVTASPLDDSTDHVLEFKSKKQQHQVSNKNVFTLILITLLICIAAYYFGF